MRASVVVLNYNSGKIIDPCIENLLAQRGVDDYEVLLVDNASTDGSTERLETKHGDDPRFRLVRAERNLGCAGGRNLGIEHARGEVLSFVDSDAYAAPDWLQNLLPVAEKPGVGIVACKLIYAGNDRLLNGLGGMMNRLGYAWDIGFGEPVEFTDLPEEALFACGNGLTTRREVVDRIGGFDPIYFNYYEDVDFSLRARRAGFEVALARDAVLDHILGLSDTINRNKLFLSERNRVRTVLRHYPLGWLVRWLPRELRFAMAGANEVPFSTRLRAWAWNAVHLPGILAWRLRARMTPLEVDRLLQPGWGYARHRGYNLRLMPDDGAVEPAVVMGEAGEAGLHYGWYEAEANEQSRFRWTDDLAACRLRTETPPRRLKLTFCWPKHTSAAAGGTLYVRCAETGRAAAAELPPGPELEWVNVTADLDLGGRTIDVILQIRRPYQETEGVRRLLGVSVERIELET